MAERKWCCIHRRYQQCSCGSNKGILSHEQAEESCSPSASISLLAGSQLSTAVQVVATSLPPEEIEGLRQLFEAIDCNGSGTITVDEMRDGLKKKGTALFRNICG